MMRMRSTFVLSLLLLAVTPVTGVTQEPVNPAQLQREQAEILRKAERLRDLMQRLLARYEREGRTQQATLLRQGLEHLQKAGLVEDVAGIRNDLQNNALTEASRRQSEVVDEIERLLNILMDRQSIENLDREIEESERMAKDAAELLKQQTELQQQTRDATRGEPNPTERAITDQLRELAQKQTEESQRNARQAGLRLPFLEDALQRLQRLMQQQGELEKHVEAELTADPNQPDQRQQRAFRIGELQQQQREVMAARTRQRDLELTADAAKELAQALERDDEALRQALSKLASRLESSVRRGADDEAGSLQKLQEQAATATPSETPRDKLAELAEQVQKASEQRRATLTKEADDRQGELRQELQRAANELGEGKPQQQGSASEALQRAAEALAKAQELAAAGKQREAMDQQAEAARNIAQAHQRDRDANPTAEQEATEMASTTAQVAQSLRKTPNGNAGEEQTAEEKAAEELDEAEAALRRAAEALSTQRDAGAPERARAGTQESRQQLQQAQQRLQKAMDEALAENSGNLRQSTEQAAARQQELKQQAGQLTERMQQAQQGGQLSEQQAKAGEQSMQRAQQSMEQAQQSLQQGRPATAAQQQQQAAEALEQASQALERNRPLTEQQQQQLQELAKEQKQIEEDIIRLAKLAEERKNRRAQEALQGAAQAAQRATQGMQEGDQEEADQQQEEARQQLEQAKDALEEERDRYMDLRQEELLFRIRDELTQFLEKQQAITLATKEAADQLVGGRSLTRPMRRKLNGLADRERELVAKATFLRTSLEEEGTLVFTHALKANEEDLEDIAGRLGGREPDPGSFTALLQECVEERTMHLLDALKREQQRRQEEQQQQQQQQQQGGENQNQQARPRLVPVVAELKMLKQMEQEMLERTQRLEQLLTAAGADAITETETALIERLGHRHSQITQIFLKMKAMIEEALAGPQNADADGEPTGPDRSKEKDK